MGYCKELIGANHGVADVKIHLLPSITAWSGARFTLKTVQTSRLAAVTKDRQ
jgi:hypothetical protein